MSSILGTMDTLPASTSALTSKLSRKRKPSPEYDYPDSSSPTHPDSSVYRRRPSFGDTSSDGLGDDSFVLPPSDDLYLSPKKKAKVTSSGDMTPATARLAQLEVNSDYDPATDESFDDLDMDAFMDVDEENGEAPPTKLEPVEISLEKMHKPAMPSELDTKPSWLSVYDALTVAEPDTLGPLNSSTSTTANNTTISALEPDGSLRFFWLDYLEHEGKLYFVGKLKDKSSGAWMSCCITIEGIQRNLFVLPRERRVEPDEEGNMCDTDIVPTSKDVHNDFEMIRKQIGVKSWKGRFVKRNYAFGESDVPRGESQWLKVVYGFNGAFFILHKPFLSHFFTDPQIPMNAESPNIAQIFGTNTSAFEILVLKRKIMGPCWLEIKNPQIDNKGVGFFNPSRFPSLTDF